MFSYCQTSSNISYWHLLLHGKHWLCILRKYDCTIPINSMWSAFKEHTAFAYLLLCKHSSMFVHLVPSVHPVCVVSWVMEKVWLDKISTIINEARLKSQEIKNHPNISYSLLNGQSMCSIQIPSRRCGYPFSRWHSMWV